MVFLSVRTLSFFSSLSSFLNLNLQIAQNFNKYQTAIFVVKKLLKNKKNFKSAYLCISFRCLFLWKVLALAPDKTKFLVDFKFFACFDISSICISILAKYFFYFFELIFFFALLSVNFRHVVFLLKHVSLVLIEIFVFIESWYNRVCFIRWASWFDTVYIAHCLLFHGGASSCLLVIIHVI